MTPGAVFERVHAALRSHLGDGTLAVGDPLEPAHLASDLMASITPVRDALHRLVGERLVEPAPGGGFRVPLLTEVGLRQLYDWNQRLLLLAIGDAPRRAERQRVGLPGPVNEHDQGAALFAAIAQLSLNPECAIALAGVSGRLASVRRREQDLLGRDDLARERDELIGLIERERWTDLKRGLIRYHRRRLKLVGDLVAILHRASSPLPDEPM